MNYLKIVLLFSTVLLYNLSYAQIPEDSQSETGVADGEDAPIDGIVKSHLVEERRILPYDQLREADIFWEKKVWRVIDTREKMNKPFVYPERMLFEIIKDGILNAEITAYSVENDKFTQPIGISDVQEMLSKQDTVEVVDPETYEVTYQVVNNDVNPADVKRYRVKEIWFFEEETSTMQVRILGIAPIIDEYDQNDNFLFERPLFWLYYPHIREVLGREDVFIEGNDAARISWENLFEMRFFSSYIWKHSNVLDARIEDLYSGVDKLLESEKVKMEIFNFEHDLWSY